MPKIEPLNIQFRVEQVNIPDFFLRPLTSPLPQPDVLCFTLTVSIKLSRETHEVEVTVHTTVLPKEGAPEEDRLAALTTVVVFSVQNFEEAIQSSETELKIPQDFAVVFNSIAISTTRGVFAAMYRGTYLQKVVLPVVDPKSFVPRENP